MHVPIQSLCSFLAHHDLGSLIILTIVNIIGNTLLIMETVIITNIDIINI